MDVKRLQELRAKHRPTNTGHQCEHCMKPPWPCEQSQLIDMALAHFHEEYPYDCECFNSGQTQAEEYAKRIGTLEAERLRSLLQQEKDANAFMRDHNSLQDSRLTLANAEAERLRAALEELKRRGDAHRHLMCPECIGAWDIICRALAGTEATPRRDTVKGERPSEGTEAAPLRTHACNDDCRADRWHCATCGYPSSAYGHTDCKPLGAGTEAQ